MGVQRAEKSVWLTSWAALKTESLELQSNSADLKAYQIQTDGLTSEL